MSKAECVSCVHNVTHNVQHANWVVVLALRMVKDDYQGVITTYR